MKSLIVPALLLVASIANAETHGGVLRSNGAFKAVADHAVSEGGSLDRVFGMKKMYKIVCDDGDIYEITWGGQSSQTGEESEHGKTFVFAKEIPDSDGAFYGEKFEVTSLEKAECP